MVVKKFGFAMQHRPFSCFLNRHTRSRNDGRRDKKDEADDHRTECWQNKLLWKKKFLNTT